MTSVYAGCREVNLSIAHFKNIRSTSKPANLNVMLRNTRENSIDIDVIVIYNTFRFLTGEISSNILMATCT